jgi:hypothetical protein
MESKHGSFVLLTLVGLMVVALPSLALAEVECRQVAPKETDAEIDEALQDHLVCADPAGATKNRLLVFLPGTRARTHNYSVLMEEAARSGLHAISLSYMHRFAVNLEICPYQNDPDCHEKIRKEIIYGEDALESLQISRTNSVVNRLVKLLQYLDAEHPDEGWGRFVADDGGPLWSSIVISGHSQGGGHATMIAKDHSVARLVIFAWADVSQGALAPWIRPPFATPPEDCYAFEHDGDRGVRARRYMWQVLGMTEFGPEVDVDAAKPPYGNSRTLSTRLTPPANSTPHRMVAGNDTPLHEDGTPVLRDVWRYLLNVTNRTEE